MRLTAAQKGLLRKRMTKANNEEIEEIVHILKLSNTTSGSKITVCLETLPDRDLLALWKVFIRKQGQARRPIGETVLCELHKRQLLTVQ
jgi:hypothetical protein